MGFINESNPNNHIEISITRIVKSLLIRSVCAKSFGILIFFLILMDISNKKQVLFFSIEF
jgi:hypothetical protein